MTHIANTVEVQHVQALNDVPWAMSRYFYNTAEAVNQTMADDFAAEFEIYYAANIAPRTRNIVKSDYVRVKDNSSAGQPWFSSETDITNTSTGGFCLPLQTCLCVSLVGGNGGIIGRTFLWGFDHNSLNAAGYPNAATTQDALDFVTGIATVPLSAGGFAGMSVIRNTGSAALPVYVATPVTNVSRSPSSAAAGWQVQTRRRDGLEGLF